MSDADRLPGPFKPGVSATVIILDGWSRDFKPEQTVSELAAAGYTYTLEQVQAAFAVHQKGYENWAYDAYRGAYG